MTKIEFLEQLRKELSDNISQSSVRENIDYYDSYITEELRKGKDEAEVLQSLGDPWVIAQTIIETASGMSAEDVYDKAERGRSSYGRQQSESMGQTPWWKKLLFVLFIIMIIMGVIAIATGLIRLLAPVFIPVLIIMVVIRRVNGRQS